MRTPLSALLLLLTAAGCSGEEPGVVPPVKSSAAAPPGAIAGEWRSRPTERVRLHPGEQLVVETGPHVVLWPAGQEAVSPPYTVRGRFRKLSGRLHEGYGLVIGGDPLDAPEAEQRYTYLLARGDGSFLIKRRVGPETPFIRAWTAHPAIRRDTEEGGEPNELEIEVGEAETVFRANGQELARIPTEEVDARGVPGIRAAHEIQLAVEGFAVRQAEPAAASPP